MGYADLEEGVMELLFDIMPDMKVNKETIFSLLRHNISKHLPPFDCMSHQMTQRDFGLYLIN